MSDLKKNIESELKKLHVFDEKQFSLSLDVVYRGRAVCSLKSGKNFKYYDLASMTKAIFPGLYFYRYPKAISKRVSSILPWVWNNDIKVKDLLIHSSGLAAHKPLYKNLIEKKYEKERAFFLKKCLQQEASQPQAKKPTYSDLGFLLLGEVIKEIEANESLEQIFYKLKKELNLPMGFHFNHQNKPKYSKKLYAPTENCSWRKRVLQGEVFDDNAHALCGVAPHAGLFGAATDMKDFGKNLRTIYNSNTTQFKKHAEGWACGFMKPSGNQSTAGQSFSKESIGHLGFTGTSFWYDPEVDLFVSVLSNRTFPDRENKAFNAFRPWVHDRIYKEFVK